MKKDEIIVGYYIILYHNQILEIINLANLKI
jgi:hypothetical protein